MLKLETNAIHDDMTNKLYIFVCHSADVQRRRACYISDWTDGFAKMRQVVPAILFLYFACLSPAVSFGTIASEITNGSIGIVEFLLSSGLSGMVRTSFENAFRLFFNMLTSRLLRHMQ